MWLTPLGDWWHKTIFKRTFWINKKLLQKWSAIRKSADCTKKTTQAKNDYIDQLQNLSTAPKIYWAILSRLLCNKKNPAISPLLVDGKRVSDFCKKANLFNSFFHQHVHQYKIYKCFTTIFIQDKCQNNFISCY